MRILIAIGVMIAALAAQSEEMKDMRCRKKLIATGWDQADTERLRQNLAEMEKRPFDGVVLRAVGQNDDGKPCEASRMFISEEWKREWFQKCVDDLKACKFKRFTDNFVHCGANPGNVDWFDDEGWRNIIEHWKIVTWVAKEGGCKGLLFDPEPYSPPFAAFRYEAQPERDKHSFEEYCVKARERGRQVMQAITEVYPDITLFCYFMDCVNAAATGEADPRPGLARLGYGLYAPFIDGWLDVVPPTVTLVDGCEVAYRFNCALQYLETAIRVKGTCQELVSPENRGKYRAQVQVSFGIYLDAYWNPPTSKWFIDGMGGPRVKRLRENVCTALRVADEYVWIYGEKFRWWPTPNKRVNEQTWPEALPGSELALAFARDPIAHARTQIAELSKAGKLVNLARNGDFSSDKAVSEEGVPEDWKKDGAPAGWHVWQDKDSKGRFAWDREDGAAGKGSARAANANSGCFIQSVKVKPGEGYVVQAVRRLKGKGDARIRIRWQTADGKWTAETLDKIFGSDGPRDQWSEIIGVVQVPEDAGKLAILLGVAGQTSPDDVAWYDDVRLYRIE